MAAIALALKHCQPLQPSEIPVFVGKLHKNKNLALVTTTGDMTISGLGVLYRQWC
jgi:hypothetical protein